MCWTVSDSVVHLLSSETRLNIALPVDMGDLSLQWPVTVSRLWHELRAWLPPERVIMLLYTNRSVYVLYLLFLIAKVEMTSILPPQCTDYPGEHNHGATWHHQRWWCEESTWSVVICCSCHYIISALTLASETWVTTDQGQENISTHESELLAATDPLPPVLLISSLCLLEYRVFKKIN